MDEEYYGDADGYVSDLDRLGDQEVFEDLCAEYDWGIEDQYLDSFMEDQYLDSFMEDQISGMWDM